MYIVFKSLIDTVDETFECAYLQCNTADEVDHSFGRGSDALKW